MKYKYIFSVFLAGGLFQLFGSIMKITHAPHADTTLKVATGVMIFSIILLIIKIITTKGATSFLNK